MSHNYWSPEGQVPVGNAMRFKLGRKMCARAFWVQFVLVWLLFF